MTRKRLTITASLLALTVGATPAIADAASRENKLMGSPTFRVWTDQFHAVAVPLDKKLARENGKYRITLTIAGKAVTKVRFKGTHASDYVYEGRVPVAGFTVDEKYTLKIAIPGQTTITRSIPLKEIPGEREGV